MRTALIPLLLLSCLLGCSSGGGSVAASSPEMAEMSKAQMSNVSGEAAFQAGATRASAADAAGGAQLASIQKTPAPAMPRAVIRSGTLTVRVDSVEKSEKVATGLVATAGGYVEGSHSDDLAGQNPSITMSLRIPVGQFENVISRCEGLGVRLSKQMSSEDVTGQLVDLDARTKTMRAEEDSLVGMLRKAPNLETIMTLQNRLTELRGTIESLQGQRKSLAGQAAMSKLDLTLQQTTHLVVNPDNDSNWLASVWTDATNHLYTVGRFLATIGIYALVFCPFLALGVYCLRRWKPGSVKAYTSEV